MPEEAAVIAQEPRFEVFRKLLIPEIFSEVLANLNRRDRLHLRLTCRDIEEAMAQSDIEIKGYPKRAKICICGNLPRGKPGLRLQLGCGKNYRKRTLKVEAEVDTLTRVRERLFKRAFTRFVDIYKIDFNTTPIASVWRLLDGCIFEELEMKVEGYEFDDSILHLLMDMDCKKISLTLKDIVLCADTLVCLPPFKKFSIVNDPWDDSFARAIDDEMFVGIVRQGHVTLNLPARLNSEEAIIAVVETLENQHEERSVSFGVEFEAVERFLFRMGYAMERDTMLTLEDSLASFSSFGPRKVKELQKRGILTMRHPHEWHKKGRPFDLIVGNVKIVVTRARDNRAPKHSRGLDYCNFSVSRV